jgi:hypothetical protein
MPPFGGDLHAEAPQGSVSEFLIFAGAACLADVFQKVVVDGVTLHVCPSPIRLRLHITRFTPYE